MLYDPLFWPSDDEPGSFYGNLVESVALADDYSWAIFRLRPEARWHDGTPVTARDVKFTFDWIAEDGAGGVRQAFQFIEGSETPRRARDPVPLPESQRAEPQQRDRHGQVADRARALLAPAGQDKDHPGAPSRQRPLPRRGVPPRPPHPLRAGPRLLGASPGHPPGPTQLRRHPLRGLSRRDHRPRSPAQGPGGLPGGSRSALLGDRLRHPGQGQGLAGAASPHAHVVRGSGERDRVQHAPGKACRPPRPAGALHGVRLRVGQPCVEPRPVRETDELLPGLVPRRDRSAHRVGTPVAFAFSRVVAGKALHGCV